MLSSHNGNSATKMTLKRCNIRTAVRHYIGGYWNKPKRKDGHDGQPRESMTDKKIETRENNVSEKCVTAELANESTTSAVE